MFFGENAYGVTAAAQEYFGKTLDQLTIAEAAALTVPIRNPSLYNLRNDSTIPLRARDAVIDNMVEEGYITAAEGETAKAEPIRTVVHEEFLDPHRRCLPGPRHRAQRRPLRTRGDLPAAQTRTLRVSCRRHGV